MTQTRKYKSLFIVDLILVFLLVAFLSCVMTKKAEAKTCKKDDATKILVEKSKKKMTLFNACGDEVKTYKVRIGLNEGPKQCDGDRKTPEGTYHIIEKRNSKYVKFLALDYPQAKDVKKAKELGCKPGDSIGIHSWIEGLPVEGSLGCITVWTKKEILEINNMVKVGTAVEILP